MQPPAHKCLPAAWSTAWKPATSAWRTRSWPFAREGYRSGIPRSQRRDLGHPRFRARLLNGRKAGQRHRDLLGRVVVVLQLAGLVVDVRLHVEVAMPAEIEENRLRRAFLFRLQRLADRTRHRVIGFGRGNDAFGARELD